MRTEVRRVVATALLAFAAAAATAASPEVDAFRALVRAEELLLEAARAERQPALAREALAAQEVARAGGALASALVAPTEAPERAALATLESAFVAARDAHAAAAAEGRRIEERIVVAQARAIAMRQVSETALAAAPAPGVVEGTWEIAYGGAGTTSGWMRLTQQGALVTGEDALLDGRKGTLTGTFAGTRVELTRIDSALGRDVVLSGAIDASGTLSGTWQATIFGRGRAEAGTFTARRQAR